MKNAPQTPNYPDILGAITGGPRRQMGDVQCAVSSRPDRVKAGHSFEAVLLIQSMVDAEVDVRVEVEFPAQDAKKQKNMFFTGSPRIKVGLQPAEVGYITIPISCSPKTAPHDHYEVRMKVLEVKRLSRHANIVRLPQGGGTFTKSTLSETVQQDINVLQELSFSIEGGKNILEDVFAIDPPGGLASLRELKPGWVSLWSMRDYLDDAVIIQRVQTELGLLLPHFNRETVFKPLLQTLQEYFKQASYPLHVAEAIFITKILTLSVERAAEQARAGGNVDDLPNWFKQIARILMQDKRLAAQPVYLLCKQVFPTLLEDTIKLAFVMTSTVTHENFGSEEEIQEYANSIVDTLLGGQQLIFARTYLPLITAGIIANARVTMPREQIRETLFMISRALEQRTGERDESNQFIFEMTSHLIERGLENFQ